MNTKETHKLCHAHVLLLLLVLRQHIHSSVCMSSREHFFPSLYYKVWIRLLYWHEKACVADELSRRSRRKVHTHTRKRTRTHTHTHIYILTHTHTCIHAHAHTHVRARTHNAPTHIPQHTLTHIHWHTYTHTTVETILNLKDVDDFSNFSSFLDDVLHSDFDRRDKLDHFADDLLSHAKMSAGTHPHKVIWDTLPPRAAAATCMHNGAERIDVTSSFGTQLNAASLWNHTFAGKLGMYEPLMAT